MRREVADYLSGAGFEVRAVAHARAMDSALAVQNYDLVLLDVMMPGEGGLSICRRLVASGGPRVIMISALGEEALDHGVDGIGLVGAEGDAHGTTLAPPRRTVASTPPGKR